MNQGAVSSIPGPSWVLLKIFEPRHEKTNNVVSDLVRQKAGCTTTEDGQRLEL